MKVMAAYVVHYGAEYLEYSIQSLQDYVDDIHIFYVPVPSFGHRTTVSCPESSKDIQDIAFKYPKVKWRAGWFNNEADHRRAYESFAEKMGYDLVVVSDYDEIWDGESLEKAIKYCETSGKQRFRVPMVHMWQDFDAVCKDLAQPVRFYKPIGNGEDYVPMKKPVWHFGYAISDKLMAYKWEIHGHKAEMRENWYYDKWVAREIEDVHPTNENFWTAEKYDKRKLPKFMKDHPRYSEKRLKPWPKKKK
jgi:hypothetical protein